MACGSRCAPSYTLACLRCTTPNPSLTNPSPRAASSSAKAPRSASSLLVSPGLNRTFSSRATSPSPSEETVDCADSPTVSVAKCTSVPRSSPRRSATGRSEYLSSGAPLGRPRCAITTTRAPASERVRMVGTLARIRPSSVMVLPSRGTFRSERTRIRLPATSPSESNSPISEGSTDVRDQVGETVGVAPLVVVPADDLDLVADHLGERRVEDARRRVGDDVGGHQRVGGVAQVATVGRLLDRRVDLLDRGLATCLEGEVGGRPGRHGNTHGEPVELALQLGQHQPDRLGGTGRGRHQVDRGGAGTTRVLVDVVLEVLVGGVGVDRGHQAL